MSEPAHVPMAERKPPGKMTVAPIAPEHVDAAWEYLAPMLSRVPEMGSRYTLDDVKGWLHEEKMQAWGIFDTDTAEMRACFCTEVVVWPQARILRIPYVAGGDLERWIGFLPTFEAWAREQGFDAIELQGRMGWGRVTGYRERFRTFVKELSDG